VVSIAANAESGSCRTYLRLHFAASAEMVDRRSIANRVPSNPNNRRMPITSVHSGLKYRLAAHLRISEYPPGESAGKIDASHLL
jgi:hypothetical protein